MARSVIGALRVNLGLDSAQFTRGTTQVQRSLNRMRNQFLAVAGVVTALGAAISEMALRSAADIDRLVKGARRIDGTTGALQALELAASESGVSISALTNDVQTMNRELARGSAGAQRALDRLGLSARELGALDADERIAVIADRVRDLGLSAGEATGLLRDLGVRNREMALLIMQGGDAIRRARDDVRDYGLEIDDALGAKIEAARDQIGRLGVVTQYFGQRLAAEVVPALGRFAQAITDSMREGGALRTLLDGLVDNLDRVAVYAAAAVTVFGVRYVAALVAARVATFTLAGGLALLRTALLRLPFLALIIGATELVLWFGRLVRAAGGFGEALNMLRDLARDVTARISAGFSAMGNLIRSIALMIQAAFVRAFAWIVTKFADMTQTIADGVNRLFAGLNMDIRVSGIGGEIADEMSRLVTETQQAGVAAADMAREQFAAAREAMPALQELRDAIAGVREETDDASESVERLQDAFNEVEAGAGGSGGARGAAAAVDDLTDSVNRLDDASRQVESSFESAFVGIVTGTMSARQAISRLLSDLARLAAQAAFRQLFGGVFGGIAAPFGGFRADGGPVQAGRSYIVGERGPELFTPGASGQITSNENLRGGGQLVVRLDLSPDLEARILQNSGEQAVEIVREYDRGMPERQAQIARDPRRR